MNSYSNDHLAGAMLGSDLAGQIQARNQGTALGKLMASLAPQIEEDRQTLIRLMDRMDSSTNPVKQAITWVVEKASRAKFTGLSSGRPDELIERAQAQYDALEVERLTASRHASAMPLEDDGTGAPLPIRQNRPRMSPSGIDARLTI